MFVLVLVKIVLEETAQWGLTAAVASFSAISTLISSWQKVIKFHQISFVTSLGDDFSDGV